jgi:hypothetical protein
MAVSAAFLAVELAEWLDFTALLGSASRAEDLTGV